MFRTRHLVASLAGVFLAACNSGDNFYPDFVGPSGPTANVQFLHASPDAPPVDVIIDGQFAIGDLDYGQGTGEQPIAATTHTLTIQAEAPGKPTTVIGPTTLTLQANTDYVIVAEGPAAGIAPVIFPHTLSVVGVNATRVQVLHAAPTAPSVTVFLTAPGADLATSSPLGTFAFQGSLAPADVPSGPYEIRITAAGTTAPVLYESGPITLQGGTDLVIAALQNTHPGPSPITLAVTDASGFDSWLPDVNTPAVVRVVHDSPDAPAISVIANANTGSPLVPTLSYEAFTPYLSLTPGTYGLGITPASNPSNVLTSVNLDLYGGTAHSVYALGKIASITTLVTRDDDRRYATLARLRLIHGSASAGPVDIYLTAPGAGIATSTPTYASVPFGGDTRFVSYAAGSYDVTVTAAGSKTPLIGPVTVALSNGGLYTAVARDAPGGGNPLGLILLDDL